MFENLDKFAVLFGSYLGERSHPVNEGEMFFLLLDWGTISGNHFCKMVCIADLVYLSINTHMLSSVLNF